MPSESLGHPHHDSLLSPHHSRKHSIWYPNAGYTTHTMWALRIGECCSKRPLPDRTIKFSYILKNIAQPFIAMVGMSVSLCVGGSVVIENIFSINGMGVLLTDAVYTLDYPLMQGILFVTTSIMALSIITTDMVCILIDPKVRLGASI